MNKNLYEPQCAVWEFTLRCNLRCLHCGGTAGKLRVNELTTAEALNLCEQLKEINTKEVTLMGGELFLRPDWYEIAQKIKSLKMGLAIITNAFILNDEYIQKLKSLKLRTLGISLDGSSPEIHDYIRGVKGSFKKVTWAIDKAKKENIPVSVITTLTKYNIYDLPYILNLILPKKFNWQIQIASCNGARMSQNDRLTTFEFYFAGAFISETIKKYSPEQITIAGAHDMGHHSCYLMNLQYMNQKWEGCPAGKDVLGIQSNGNIKGCLSLYNDKFVEGNIREIPLPKLWNDPKKFVINRYFQKKFLKGFCKDCQVGLSCQAGCKDVAQSITESPYNNPYCFYKIEEQNCKNIPKAKK